MGVSSGPDLKKRHRVINPCVAFSRAPRVDHGNSDAVFKEVLLLLVLMQQRQAVMTASACAAQLQRNSGGGTAQSCVLSASAHNTHCTLGLSQKPVPNSWRSSAMEQLPTFVPVSLLTA
ncbi:Uncharacterized protein DAT39_011295 [Clarias magur]|uniref:Uncharacterized protein n=1 Tax=Clarias magur TaxID=1594786 RepID=A0A8J4X0C4_CLAMG|nr:Uncharacterized protein DAT39_011295 [Clarias magur]